ncbi:hypothetical protein ACFL1E_01035 [Candidatus Omnitrophota bacterium]
MFCNRVLLHGKKAQALVVVYMVVAAFTVLCVALLSKAINERNLALRNRLEHEAFYLAEGAIEDAIAQFSSAIANYQIQPDANFNTSTTFTMFGSEVINSTITDIEGADRPETEGETNILVRNFQITATAVHPENNEISVTLHQIIARRLIPTFQHSVFYDDDLEMLPGPDMDLSGRIHCNEDIYVDAGNGSVLTIDSTSFHSAGNIYNQRKDTGAEDGGEVSIRVTKPGAPQYEDMDNLDSEVPTWTVDATTRWQGTVRSADHGVTELTAPSVASIQPDGYYATNADVIIENGEIRRNGVLLVEGTDYPVDTIKTTNSFYNNREERLVKMTEIDLRKLAGYEPGDPEGSPTFATSILPPNGLLYATRDDAGAVRQPGIKLVNGEKIYQNIGLTVVSNDPVYIQGDYNTDDEKPAAVICDALNLLSNNWDPDDTESTSSLNNRMADETTFNTVFVAGIDTTTPGVQYNGGLENYPRMHENWSGINLNIKGSFVALWNSAIATGEWVYGNPQYTAPRRNWQYNTDLNDTSKLPPFTPWAVEVERVAWWKE